MSGDRRETGEDKEIMVLSEVMEYRMGRNFIRVGDVVRITPSKPKKRDGGIAKVQKMVETTEGVEFHVAMKDRLRVFREDRVQRVQQVRGGEQRKAR